MRHYVLTTSGDIVVCFHTAVCLSCYFVNIRNGVFNLLLGELYPRENEVIPKSEKAIAYDRVLKLLYDADLRHVESSARCHRKYKNGRIKGDLG